MSEVKRGWIRVTADLWDNTWQRCLILQHQLHRKKNFFDMPWHYEWHLTKALHLHKLYMEIRGLGFGFFLSYLEKVFKTEIQPFYNTHWVKQLFTSLHCTTPSLYFNSYAIIDGQIYSSYIAQIILFTVGRHQNFASCVTERYWSSQMEKTSTELLIIC